MFERNRIYEAAKSTIVTTCSRYDMLHPVILIDSEPEVILLDPEPEDTVEVFHPDYSPETSENSETSIDLSEVINFDKIQLEKYVKCLVNCLPLRLGFLTNHRSYKQCLCPCHSMLKYGWRSYYKFCFTTNEDCVHKPTDPQGLINHLKENANECLYHYAALNFLTLLYCDEDGALRPCVSPEAITCPVILSKYQLQNSVSQRQTDHYERIENMIDYSLDAAVVLKEINDKHELHLANLAKKKKAIENAPPEVYVSALQRKKKRSAVMLSRGASSSSSSSSSTPSDIALSSTPSDSDDSFMSRKQRKAFVKATKVGTHDEVSITQPSHIVAQDEIPTTSVGTQDEVSITQPSHIGAQDEIPTTSLQQADIPSELSTPVAQPPQVSNKKKRQKMNEKRMRKIKDKWKKHKNYLEKGILLPENLIDEETKNPSFSMMHSLSQGFSIMLFSATHKTKARRGMLHKPNAVRLVLGPDMVLIWHERTYHCGTRSRLTKNREQGDKGFHLSTMEADLSPSRRKSNVPRPYEHLEDMRLFAYVWNETGKLFRTRKDGRARSSDEIYQKEGYTCDDFFKEHGDPNNSIKCQECQRGTLVFDLSFLQSNQYANGEVILGDLEKYGWCVYRSNNISDIVESEIKNICARGTSWTRIHGKRLMKYAKCATYPQAWESPAIKKCGRI